MEKSVPTVHAIDGDGNVHPELESILKDFNVPTFGNDYFVISILGCQSSGKSTLLNHLFGTKFEVLNAKMGRNQTTLGVWLGVTKSNDKNVIVLDVEGTDSKERGEDHGIFERKTSLLSLALSEMLIINMWIHDIGRFDGANYGLLKIVLELNLQLFQTSGKNKQLLLFVIREHSSEDSPIDILASQLKDDLTKIWNTIIKPPQYENSSIDDFFQFEFIPLPSKKYQPAEFEAEVNVLRTRILDSTSDKYILQKDIKKDVPSDGFARYLSEIWEAIQQNKELNLPSQKQMLSIYRCDQIASEAIEMLRDLIDKFEPNPKDFIKDFKKDIEDRLDQALTYYDENASRYEPSISANKRDQLISNIGNELSPFYKAQVKIATKKCLDTLNQKISSLSDYSEAKDINKVLDETTSNVQSAFKEYLDSIIVEKLNWDAKSDLDSFNETVDDMVSSAKTNCLVNMIEKKYKSFNQDFTRMLRKLKESRTLDVEKTWTDISNKYKETAESIRSDFEEYAKELRLQEDRYENYLKKIDTNLEKSLKDVMKEISKDAYVFAEDVFATIFTKTSNGLPRKWSFGTSIEKEFINAKNVALRMLDILSVVRLNSEDMKYSWFIEDSNGLVKLNPDMPEIPEDLVIIPYDECNRHIDYFTNRTDFELKKAQLEQANLSSTKYPLIVAIVMFLIFGWDELFMILSSPILLFFTTIFGVGIYFVYKLDLFPYIVQTVLILKDQLIKQLAKEKTD